MDRGTHRDVADRQAVAGLDRGFSTVQQLGANLHALRRNDVAAFAVGVAQQRDVSGAVRVVFDPFDAAHDTVLVAPEVHHAVVMLVTTALVTGRDVTVVVTTGILLLLFEQRCIRRTLVKIRRDDLE